MTAEVTIEKTGRAEAHRRHRPRQTVVVPTFNERDNIATLLDRLNRVLPTVDTEFVFVDDSSDDTPEVIAAAAAQRGLPVVVHHRAKPTGGLGGAVVEGLRRASGEWVVVMDADLQHPPELVPDLVAAGIRDGADLVVGSRYAGRGRRDGLASGYRRWVSGGSTLLAKLAFRRALVRVSDPMSGFFAIRASSLETAQLRPLGYKILLELIVRTRPPRVVEVPYAFQPRHAGQSKSTVREGLRFLRHVAILAVGGARLRMAGFALIGVVGLVPNLVTLWLLTDGLGLHHLWAAVIATQVALVYNLALTEVVFWRRRHRSLVARGSRFLLLGNVDLLLRVPVLAVLVGGVGLGYLMANLATLVGSFLIRFAILDRLVYAPGRRS